MSASILLFSFTIIICLTFVQSQGLRSAKNNVTDDDGKSSLVFVFDKTGSMYNDLEQLRAGAETILKTALEDSNVIADFVFVPFHDPVVGPATVTKDKEVFKTVLNNLQVYGGGDCPEKCLGGIQMALNVSRPRSFVYVFTDATANDHRLVGKVLDAVQRKQSQVVFVMTGHCHDLNKPSYQVYQQIAAASSGQVFNLNKTSVHKVLEFVRGSIRGRNVNLGSAVNPPGYNYTQKIPVDSSLDEVTVSVSGEKPRIRVVSPAGRELTGPPQLITTLDLSEIMIVKVLQPEVGNWSITVGSAAPHSVRLVGLSNLTFTHGFSVERTELMNETSYRPLQGTYNHMLISLSQTNVSAQLDYAEILGLDGKVLFEVPLREVDRDNKVYIADAFVPPDDFFNIAINGKDMYGQELRRVGATALQPKQPDIPYLVVPQKVSAAAHSRVVLRCRADSLVPLAVAWARGPTRLQPAASRPQSTSVEYVIEDMTESNVDTYRCVARNVAGVATAETVLDIIVESPQVSISPVNLTLNTGDELTLSCSLFSDARLLTARLTHTGLRRHYDTNFQIEQSEDGFYTFNKTIKSVSENDTGLYTCVASNRGGETNQSSYIIVVSEPTAQILGPHSLSKSIYTDVQLVCHVENAWVARWVGREGVLVEEKVNGNTNVILEVRNLTDDASWTCLALRGNRRASDSVEVKVLIEPMVMIHGPRNITAVLGDIITVTCEVRARPSPRVLWHRETEEFLNHTMTIQEPDIYTSVLTLNSRREAINGTYFCFGENSEGIAHDNITIAVRRKLALMEGFTDHSVQLYSQVELHCRVDPPISVTWYHNGTSITPNDHITLLENNALHIMKVGFSDLGQYACEAYDGYDSIVVNGTLSVVGLESPLLLKEPINIKTQLGQSTILTCRILKGNPKPTISWQYVKGDNVKELTGNVTMKENQYELLLSNVTVEHDGVYRCVAANDVGSDTHDMALVVQYPPQFNNPKGSKLETTLPLEVKIGENITLVCEARGFPPPIVVWTKDNLPLRYSKRIVVKESGLTIEGVKEKDSGQYSCVATSPLGAARRNYTVIVYSIPEIVNPGGGPEVEVWEGQLVELSCAARGRPAPAARWLHDRAPLDDSRKYVDETALRFVANLTDFGEYICIAENQYGNASVTYNVFVWVPPSVEISPEIPHVIRGHNLSVECNAVGFPLPDLTWEFRGQILMENTSDISITPSGSLFIKNVSPQHEGPYACIAENIAGVAHDTMLLRVHEAPVIVADNYSGPYIATNLDTALTIPCRAEGIPKPYVVWSKNNQFLDKDFRYETDAFGTLTIKHPNEDLSGNYTCLAKNSVGNATRTVTVDIYPVLRLMQSDEGSGPLSALEGGTLDVECPVRGITDTVKWYKDAVLISEGTLHIGRVSRATSGRYACVASNVAATASATVTVSVYWPPAFVDPHQQNVSVVKGDDAYLDCSVDANPTAETKWLFNYKPLVGERQSKLKLLKVQPHQGGEYKCVVSNEHGSVERVFTLDVLVPPFISELDVIDVTLRSGDNATLPCDARGSPQPTVEWTFNNTSWRQHNTSLVGTNVSVEAAGASVCRGRNPAGVARLAYRVRVVAAPVVRAVLLYSAGEASLLDRALDVPVGTNIRVACEATGTPIPTIQWHHEDELRGQNSQNIRYADLRIEPVENKDGGIYTCVAANEAGMDERKLKLNVLEPPTIETLVQYTNSSNIINLQVISGYPYYLHCHPRGNPPPDVYWFYEHLPLRFFDDSMVSRDYGEVISTDKAREEQTGNYTCVARNKVGETSVVYLVDVLVAPSKPKENVRVVSVGVGKPLQLTCPAAGRPPPTVSWLKHPYTELAGNISRMDIDDERFTLTINNSEISDSGKYSCIITNVVGSSEVTFDVTVEQAPRIVSHGGSVDRVNTHVVALGRSLVLKCEADGNPLPKLYWIKDLQQLPDNLANVHQTSGSSVLGVWAARARDAGQYVCVAHSRAGDDNVRHNVIVQVPGKWGTWSSWSLCNVSCGHGAQHRERLCLYLDDDNNAMSKANQTDKLILDESGCKGSTVDRRKCHMPPCETESKVSRWLAWSAWSVCSATCGAAAQSRTRRCRGHSCQGDNFQIRKCTNLPKCVREESDAETITNDVYISQEELNLSNQDYMPAATFEMFPETVDSPSSDDVEEFHVTPVAANVSKPIYYIVNVTFNLDNSERGHCEPGFRLHSDGSCIDVDECALASNRCHATQACRNAAGGYACGCPAGYFAHAAGTRCQDINECALETAGCEYACVNVAGGYVCACPRRLRLHRDRVHCVPPQLYLKPYEDIEKDYLSTSVEFPARYTKYSRH